MEKDIRDYSVPINFYCEDYKSNDDKRSPLKAKNVLEPILEESKSSYGDECNTSQNDKKDVIETSLTAVLAASLAESDCEVEISNVDFDKVEEIKCVKQLSTDVNVTETDIHDVHISYQHDLYQISEQEINNDVNGNIKVALDNEAFVDIGRQVSLASTMSSNDRVSFDSTAEFEKYEVVADIIAIIIGRIEIMLTAIKVTSEINNVQNEEAIETFSIAKIIEDIEQNVYLNDTILTEVSDSDYMQTNKVVESIVYYIFDRVMFVSREKSKTNKKNEKKVITVVDSEDILYTAKYVWLDSNEEEEMLNIEPIQIEQLELNVHQKNKQTDTDFNLDSNIGFNVKENRFTTEIMVEAKNLKSQADSEDTYSIQSGFNTKNVSDENDTKVIIKNTNKTQRHMAKLKTLNDFGNQLDSQVEESILRITEYIYDVPNDTTNKSEDVYEVYTTDVDENLNETFIYSSAMNNAFLEEVSHDDESLPRTDLEHAYLDISAKKSNADNLLITEKSEHFNDVPHQISHDENINENQDSLTHLIDSDQEYYCYDNPALSLNEEPIYGEDDHDLSALETSYQISSDAYFTPPSCTDDPQKFSSSKVLSRSSSPNITPIFELEESPIKTNLKLRHSLNNTVSPFIKKQNVISIKQTENSGGVKFWVSFDDKLVEHEKRTSRAIKSADETLPSFISIDIDEGKPKHFAQKGLTKRSSVLFNDYKQEFYGPLEKSIDFDGCDSDMKSRLPNDCEIQKVEDVETVPQKRLLYEVHSKPSKRQYSSWPPYEDTLFYKIISQFRMSESFDPSDLEGTRFE